MPHAETTISNLPRVALLVYQRQGFVFHPDSNEHIDSALCLNAPAVSVAVPAVSRGTAGRDHAGGAGWTGRAGFQLSPLPLQEVTVSPAPFSGSQTSSVLPRRGPGGGTAAAAGKVTGRDRVPSTAAASRRGSPGGTHRWHVSTAARKHQPKRSH